MTATQQATTANQTEDEPTNATDDEGGAERQTPTPMMRVREHAREHVDAKARSRRARVAVEVIQREANQDEELAEWQEEKQRREDWAEAAREDGDREEAREHKARVRELRPQIVSRESEYQERATVQREQGQEAEEEARKAENRAKRLLEKHELDVAWEDVLEDVEGEE